MVEYNEDATRVLGLERSNRELIESVRKLSVLLEDVADLRRSEARTRRLMRTVVAGGLALLLASAFVTYVVLLVRVNHMIDERREAVEIACLARNQQRDDMREHFSTLAAQDGANTDVWVELTQVYGGDQAVNCKAL